MYVVKWYPVKYICEKNFEFQVTIKKKKKMSNLI